MGGSLAFCYASTVASSRQTDYPTEGNLAVRKQPAISNWLFQQEIPIPEYVASLLLSIELPIAAYATLCDSAIFTTKRLILRDVGAWGIRRWRCNRCRLR